MPLVISHQQWMSRTRSRLHRRSDDLKRIDVAIQRRDEAAAKAALIQWIDGQNKKRQDWHRSVRNGDGAVEELYRQLKVLGSEVPYGNVTEEMDDKLAKAHIRREHRLAATKMFNGKQLRFKDSFWGISRRKASDIRTRSSMYHAAKTTAGVGSKAAAAGVKTYTIANGLKQTIQGITGTLQPATQSALVQQVFGTSAAQFATQAAPYIGLVSSGASAVKDWVGVAQKIQHATRMESSYGDVRLGDPSAALHAVVAIIDRQIKKQTADATIHTTAFTAKGASAAADWGTATTAAIGVVETVAILLNMLVDLVIDAKQVEAGNAAITAGDIDLTIFSKSPILGCYYVVVQDHSTIMDFDFENMGKENWQQEAERLQYAITPVIKKSSQLIQQSRVEILGMESAKGVYRKSIKNTIKTYYKSKGYGQSSKMPGIGSDDTELLELIDRMYSSGSRRRG